MKRTRGAAAGEPASGAGTAAELERMLEHTFARPELLRLALTHRSYVYEAVGGDTSGLSDPGRDNEQLEFLGDAVLGLLAADGLFRRFPGSREGELTRLRAALVSRKHMGQVGTRLKLGRWLRLGKGLERDAGRKSAVLYANAMEALIAALYLDGGLEVARRFVEAEVLAPAIEEMERMLAEGDAFYGVVGDSKSALQEMLQAEGLGQPEYRLVSESGPDHRRVFRVEVRVEGGEGTLDGVDLRSVLSEAEGPSKKQAQQEAARLAVVKLAGVLKKRTAEVGS